MTPSLLSLFRCPVCRAELSLSADGKVCACSGARKHCFDVAKSGYLNFAGPRPGEGDGKEAVLARRSFLDAGYYRPLSDAVNAILTEVGARTVLDAGCGEGYYTNRMGNDDRAVIGVDLSKDGIDLAARRAKQTGSSAAFVVGSIFDLPVADGAFDAVTNLFAPCAEKEFCRILRNGGYLLLVGAGENHLFGLKRAIYENPYVNPGRADLPAEMELIRRDRLRDTITVAGTAMIRSLFSMTPYYWRTSPRDREKLDVLEELTTEVDFDIYLYRKRMTL